MVQTTARPLFRFKWSHQAGLHRGLVKVYNAAMRQVPFTIKYRAGVQVRQNKAPYSLVKGKTVIQVGAPHDTLKAGRSRGMYFSLMAGAQGKVIIVEPDPQSVETFKKTLAAHRINNTIVHWSGAWSGPSAIELHVDPSHPATNFSSGTVAYDQERLRDYKTVQVQANSLDNIVSELGVGRVDLVSITTNWAELEILQGMKNLIANGLTYICLAYGNPGTDYVALMNDLGYAFFSHDDRGMTFKRKTA